MSYLNCYQNFNTTFETFSRAHGWRLFAGQYTDNLYIGTLKPGYKIFTAWPFLNSWTDSISYMPVLRYVQIISLNEELLCIWVRRETTCLLAGVGQIRLSECAQ